MKNKVEQKEVTFTCLCGESFKALSTSKEDVINVEKFKQKYGMKN